MKRIVILFICFLFFSFGTCRKYSIDCSRSVYSFEAKAKINNPSDSINIGDTIWLQITSPLSQIDANSGQIITYSKAANLGTAIGIGELVPPSGKEAANDFNYYLLKGTLLNNPNTNAIREYLFSESSLDYQFLLGVIPKRKGVFSIGLSNASNVYRKDDNCKKAFYRIYFTQTPLHLYFVKQAFGNTPDSSYFSPYCFKVK